MSDIAELLARLRAARGADVALGLDVMRACGWVQRGHWWTPPDRPDVEQMFPPPDPTGSLDAALTLVPARLSWAIKGPQFQSLSKRARAYLESGEHEWIEEGATPALALCVAVLLARHA